VVLPVTTLRAATARLRSLGGGVEAIGYAGPRDRLAEVSAVAADVAAPRLCPLECLLAPPFAWHQSGHARLGSFTGGELLARPAPTFA
jgi:hypothetical protein